MQRINEITSRIQAIQARVEQPGPPGGFGSVLNAAMSRRHGNASAPRDGQSPGDDHPSGIPGAALDVSSLGTRNGITLGTMLGGPTPLAAIGTGPMTAMFPRHHVPDGVVATSAELADYMATNQIEARNGRLANHELAGISGSWHGTGRLLPPAAEAWELMRAAAGKDGIDLRAIDTYRTWESQERAHHKHLSGEKTANVLPPGRSRHGAGLAIDVTNGNIIGRHDPEWQWLATNARSFGWHPISNESWHWEFRGV